MVAEAPGEASSWWSDTTEAQINSVFVRRTCEPEGKLDHFRALLDAEYSVLYTVLSFRLVEVGVQAQCLGLPTCRYSNVLESLLATLHAFQGRPTSVLLKPESAIGDTCIRSLEYWMSYLITGTSISISHYALQLEY